MRRKFMKRTAYLALVVLMTVSLSSAAPEGKKGGGTFTGEIGDKLCGFKHMMPGGAKECTLECVDKMKSKFVLVDKTHKKVYELSDQTKPREFAGQNVKVTGTLKGAVIEVASVEAAK